MPSRHAAWAAGLALIAAACGRETPESVDTTEETETAAQAESETAGPIELAPEPEPEPRLAEAEAWLAENAERDAVTVTDSGLQYEVLQSGPDSGSSPAPDDWICAQYTGTLVDGSVFDSSRVEGRPPLAYPAGELIEGWVEALSMMKPGDRWKLYIHPEIGYGAEGAGGVIPPHAALVFDMELLGVVDGQVVPVDEAGRPDPSWDCRTAL